MSAAMAKTRDVMEFVKQFKAAGIFKVDLNREAGTLQVHDRDVVVYWAMQKGAGGPWIIRTKNGPNVEWGG